MSLQNSTKADEQRKLKKGNAEPYARYKWRDVRGGRSEDTCDPWLLFRRSLEGKNRLRVDVEIVCVLFMSS